jgi:hypothetical protein
MPSFEIFDNELQVVPDGGSAIAYVDETLRGKLGLLRSLSSQLSFPDYFGENWDAFEECLLDLLPNYGRSVIIVHRAMPVDLSEPDLLMYLRILRSVMERREKAGEPRLRGIFAREVMSGLPRSVRAELLS